MNKYHVFKSYEEKEGELYNRKNKDSIFSNDSEDDQQKPQLLKPVLEKNLINFESSLGSRSNTFDDIEKLTSPSQLKPLDIINQKISKLDSFFSTVLVFILYKLININK